MPWFSYHGGHSGEFCRHAKGRLSEVVERAWRAGFSHYGLSEHCPRTRAADLFEDELDLGVGGLKRLFGEYQTEAARLRDEYADRIEILVGFETERLPPDDWAAVMAGLRETATPDFVVGSVHHVNGRCIDYSKEDTQAIASEMGGRVPLERAYFDDLAELVSVLRPEIVGHIDLIRKFDGDGASFSDDVWPHIEGALDSVQAAGAVLDVNPGAYRRGMSPVYPLPRILTRAREMGIGVTLGDDGHGAHDVGAGLDACMNAIEVAGYQEIAYFRRRGDEMERASAPLAEVKPGPTIASEAL